MPHENSRADCRCENSYYRRTSGSEQSLRYEAPQSQFASAREKNAIRIAKSADNNRYCISEWPSWRLRYALVSPAKMRRLKNPVECALADLCLAIGASVAEIFTLFGLTFQRQCSVVIEAETGHYAHALRGLFWAPFRHHRTSMVRV